MRERATQTYAAAQPGGGVLSVLSVGAARPSRGMRVYVRQLSEQRRAREQETARGVCVQ